MWLDDKLIYDCWQSGDFKVDVEFSGNPQRIRIDYQKIFGPASLKVFWSQPNGFPEQPLPVEVLFHEYASAEKMHVPVPKGTVILNPFFPIAIDSKILLRTDANLNRRPNNAR